MRFLSHISCVVQGLPFEVGVLAPICIIIVVNYVMLGLVIRGINKSAQMKNESARQVSKHMKKV